jgi:plasmid stabilization system protein ParE
VEYRILFTKKALSDLEAIIGHIAEDDPEAGMRFGEAVLDHVELLSCFPYMGALTRRRPRVRKLIHSPITVYYQVREERRLIEVLHVRHEACRVPRL